MKRWIIPLLVLVAVFVFYLPASGAMSNQSGIAESGVIQNTTPNGSDLAIFIRKQAKGPDSRTFPSGSDVEFEIEVKNIGDGDLINIIVTDPLTPDCADKQPSFNLQGLNDDTAPPGNLPPGDPSSYTYTCTAVGVTTGFTNEVEVTAKFETDPARLAEDSDDSTVVIEEVEERAVRFLIIDEDGIDNDNPAYRDEDGSHQFSEMDVNDDVAEVGVRAQLRFFEANFGKVITLPTGQVGDEGWFALENLPAYEDFISVSDWPSPSLGAYIGEPFNFDPGDSPPHGVGPGLGAPDPDGAREALLDKVNGVVPLRAAGLQLLVGGTYCVVVYDSDISINYGSTNGSLKGDNLGTVAFTVLELTGPLETSDSSLPGVTIQIENADEVCQGLSAANNLFEDTPVPDSSSEPFHVNENDDADYMNGFWDGGALSWSPSS